MAFRTRRQKMYSDLLKLGFARFEAFQLSKVPRKHIPPYMRGFISQRAKEYKQAIKEGWSQAHWNKFITQKYKDSKWLNDKGKCSVWEMLRSYEDRYKDKHPAYDSPWQKNTKKQRDYIHTIEKKIAPLPKKPKDWSPEAKARAEAQRQEALKHLNAIRAKQ